MNKPINAELADKLMKERPCSPKRAEQGWVCEQWRTATNEWFCGLCGLPLPPVLITLDPWVGFSAPPGGNQRKIDIRCERKAPISDGDLKDFRLEIDCSDEEPDDDFPLPLEPSEGSGKMGLGLKKIAGRSPFDVTVRVRHVKRKDNVQPVVVGYYDYPIPTVAFEPLGPIVVPEQPSPFTIRLLIAPVISKALSTRLEIPALSLTLPGIVSTARDGSHVMIGFTPNPSEWRILATLHGSSPANLSIAFRGVADEVSVSCAVERKTPPNLQIFIAENTRGLAGRRARVAMLFRNVGGSAGVVDAVCWTLTSNKGIAASGDLAEFKGSELSARSDIHEELRPLLTDAVGVALRPGHYRLKVDVDFRAAGAGPLDPKLTTQQSAEIEVRPDQDFAGRVCIDFGTTDTAAAVLLFGESYFSNRGSGKTPFPLELSRIGFLDKAPRFFLPTLAAVGTDDDDKLVTAYAEQAAACVARVNHGRLVDRLKWRLSESIEIDGHADRISIEQLVAGYLEHVRKLIEEHPAVAARVKRVVATRPARFGRMADLLIKCFAQAGMEVDLECFGEGVAPLVSESWPPVLFALPINEGGTVPPSTKLLKSLLDKFQGETPPSLIGFEKLTQTPHYLCTFDIGGGSTDISLLRLQIVDGQILVKDLTAFTDRNFAGERFRDLILEECARLVPDAPYGDIEGLRRDNLGSLRRLAAELQNFPNGPFLKLILGTEAFFTAFAAETPANQETLLHLLEETPNDPSDWPPKGTPKFAREFWDDIIKSIVKVEGSPQHYPGVHHLNLKSESGAPIRLTFAAGSAPDLMFSRLLLRTTLRFFKAYDATISDIFKKIAARLGENTTAGPVRILLTGRGGLFPLAESLIRTRMKVLDGASFYHSGGESAKAITSWGAVALRAARDAGSTLEFEGLSGPGYAVYATDPISTATTCAVLRPIDDSNGSWGLPLTELGGVFERVRRLIASENMDNADNPEELARRDGFDLKRERNRHPDGWIVFNSTRNQLAVRHSVKSSGTEDGA